MKKCKKCYLPETYPNTSFNEKGICNYCSDEIFIVGETGNEKISKEKKDQLKKDFENLIKKSKGKSKYDCLLLFSGGKDSSYLLYLLTKKYKLKVLTVTVDNGLESPLAKSNINKIVKYFNVDHIFSKPKKSFLQKFYKYFITHINNQSYCERVCYVCQELIFSTGIKIAVDKKIPFIILGYSPDQAGTNEFLYWKNPDGFIPKELYDKPFDEEDRAYFWRPETEKKQKLPRFILPFYFLEYPGVEKIIKILNKLGLGSANDFDQLKTNCHLNWLLMRLDAIKKGYVHYVPYVCSQIRSGKIKQRKKYFIVLTLGIWLLKHGFVKRKYMTQALRFLGLKFNEIQ